jgi:O-antigen ligase
MAPVCLILTLGLYFLRGASPLIAAVVISILVIIAILAVVLFVSVGADEALRFAVGDPTLTGRDQIWHYSLSLFWQSPMEGRGYGAVWSVGIFSILQLPQMSETSLLRGGHNGYLDVMTESGIIGLGLSLVFLTSILYRLWVRIPYHNSRLLNFVAIYTFFAITLEDLVVSTIFRSGTGFWIYFLLVAHASIFLNSRWRMINRLKG